jgi:cytoskeletal protein CcmA (bactofilin family)
MAARAAGTFRWRGEGAGTKTTWEDGRNWVNAAGSAWGQTMYPGYDDTEHANVDGDTVIFDAAVTTSPAGFDGSAKGDLLKIQVLAAFNGTIASSGTQLYYELQAAGEVTVQGALAGAIYLKGASTNGLTTVTVLDLKTGSTLYLDGKIGTLMHTKGTVILAATSTVAAALTVSFTADIVNDANLTITAAATIPATIEQRGGTVACNVAVTTLNQSGGLWTQAAGNITTARVTGGEIKHNAGNITTLYVSGTAVYNGSGAAVARTITDLWQYDSSRVNVNDNARTIVITRWHLMTANPAISVVPGQTIAV